MKTLNKLNIAKFSRFTVEKEILEHAFTEIGGRLCELIGWRKTIGQIYTVLYLSEFPLSLDDIADQIKMSKSSVWGILKKLQRLNAVNKVWIKEKRKDYFIAEKEIDIIIKNGIIPELNSKLLFFNNYLEQAKSKLADSGKEVDNEEILTNCQNFIDEMNKMKEKFDSFLSFYCAL